MPDIPDALNLKLQEAEFFLEKIRAESNAFARRCYLSAYLAAVRSVALYVRKRLEDSGRIVSGDDNGWRVFIETWEAASGFDIYEIEKWRFVKRLRNVEIHEEPIVPKEERHGGMFPVGFWPDGYFPSGFWGDSIELILKNPNTDELYELFDACETAVHVTAALCRTWDAI